jgi:DNA modification methylase
MTVRIIIGDVREQLKLLPSNSVHCVVTSPPYWGLRDYGVVGQIGLEEDFEDWLAAMMDVFDEVRRVLRPNGVAWVNLGDCYANDGKWGGATGGKHTKYLHGGETRIGRERRRTGLKPKDLVGMPWRFAFAARDAGWWLRRDIIWHKLNPLPESVLDRPTTAHEYLFMLTKSEKYFYDADAIMEPTSPDTHARAARGRSQHHKWADGGPGDQSIAKRSPSPGRTPGVTPKSTTEDSDVRAKSSWHASTTEILSMRNKRSVWSTTSEAFAEAHFATFPPALIEPCILAGCPRGGVVLDPFGGAGTTGLVADRLQRDAILIELNPEYAAMARRRVDGDSPLFARAAE